MALIAYDPQIHKLGKHAPLHDPKTLQFAKYLTASPLPTIPKVRDWTLKAAPDFGLMLNDTLGCCTCSGMGHAVQVWTSMNGLEVTVPDAAVETAYEGACGYKKGDPSTDQGGNELAVLNYWRKTGIGGYKIDAFTALEPRNYKHVEAAIDLFGLSYIGVALPLTAQKQIGGIWSVVPHSPDAEPGSWGGHCVIIVEYDEKLRRFACVTWGGIQWMTYDFWKKYVDEAYAPLSQQWFTNGVAPSGFDYAALQADLALL